MWLCLAWCLPVSFHFGLPWTLPLQHLACCFSPFAWTLRFAQSTKFPRPPETTVPHPGIKCDLLHGCNLPFQGGGQAVTYFRDVIFRFRGVDRPWPRKHWAWGGWGGQAATTPTDPTCWTSSTTWVGSSRWPVPRGVCWPWPGMAKSTPCSTALTHR